MVVGRNGFKLVVRVPIGMEAALRAAALESGRSRNSEIVVRLASSIGYKLDKQRRNMKRK